MPHLKHVPPITDAQKKLLLFPKRADTERVASAIVWNMEKQIREARTPYLANPYFRMALEQSLGGPRQ